MSIIIGDCLNVMGKMPDSSVDCVITSPPYNVGKEYEERQTIEDYLTWTADVIAECARLVRPGGHIFWQVGNYTKNGSPVPLDILTYPAFVSAGAILRNRIIWTFGHGLHCKKRLSGRHETVMWFTIGDNYKFNLDPIRIPQKYPAKRYYKGPKKGQLSGNPLGKNPGDVWEISNVKHNHPEKTAHPCQFPEELIRRIVLLSTSPGDVVLDPFFGSGTVGKVCSDIGREWTGIELREDYACIARNRITTPA